MKLTSLKFKNIFSYFLKLSIKKILHYQQNSMFTICKKVKYFICQNIFLNLNIFLIFIQTCLYWSVYIDVFTSIVAAAEKSAERRDVCVCMCERERDVQWGPELGTFNCSLFKWFRCPVPWSE